MEKAILEERGNCSLLYMKKLEHPWPEALQKGLPRGDSLDEDTTCHSLQL